MDALVEWRPVVSFVLSLLFPLALVAALFSVAWIMVLVGRELGATPAEDEPLVQGNENVPLPPVWDGGVVRGPPVWDGGVVRGPDPAPAPVTSALEPDLLFLVVRKQQDRVLFSLDPERRRIIAEVPWPECDGCGQLLPAARIKSVYAVVVPE